MWKKLLYAVGIGILAVGLCEACRGKLREEEGGLKRIRFEEKKTKLKRSDLLEVVDMIHLETKDSSLLGYIPKLIKRPSGFYIWSVGQIVKFHPEGRFLYRIDQWGRGPKEYQHINAISVDGQDRYLYLHVDHL